MIANDLIRNTVILVTTEWPYEGYDFPEVFFDTEEAFTYFLERALECGSGADVAVWIVGEGDSTDRLHPHSVEELDQALIAWNTEKFFPPRDLDAPKTGLKDFLNRLDES